MSPAAATSLAPDVRVGARAHDDRVLPRPVDRDERHARSGASSSTITCSTSMPSSARPSRSRAPCASAPTRPTIATVGAQARHRDGLVGALAARQLAAVAAEHGLARHRVALDRHHQVEVDRADDGDHSDGDRADDEVPEARHVELHRHLRVGRLLEAPVEVDHRRPARPAPLGLDGHEGLDAAQRPRDRSSAPPRRRRAPAGPPSRRRCGRCRRRTYSQPMAASAAGLPTARRRSTTSGVACA